MSGLIRKDPTSGNVYVSGPDQVQMLARIALGMTTGGIPVPLLVLPDGTLVTSGGGGGGGTGSNPFSNGIPTLVGISADSVIVAEANSTRKYLRISLYASATMWVQYNAPAVVGRGQRVSRGQTFEIKGDALFQGDVHVITDGPSVNVDVFEGS